MLGGEGGGGRDGLFVDFDRVLVPEGRVPRQELVDEDAQGPPVDGGGVALVVDDLGGQVLGGSAEGVGLDRGGVAVAEALGEAKVDELDVPVRVEEEVLGLHVAVGDAALLLVQVLEDEHDLGRVEARDFLVEAPELAQVREELAARDVVEQDVEEVAVREGGDVVGDEGVARDVGEDLALVADVVDLLEFDDWGLVSWGCWGGWEESAYLRSCAGS